MKKIFQYSVAALVGLVLAGCTGDYTDWASPQTNPAENPAEKYGVTIVAGENANIVMPVRDDNVKLVALNASSEKVADFVVTSLTINGEPINASVDKGNIVVSATALNELIQKQFNSRASIARTLDVESTVSLILNNGDAVTTDVKGQTTGTFTAKPTPAIDPKGYYILGNFEGNGWDLATPIWMEKESEGVYTAVVTLSGDGDAWYKFYEGSHYENGNWDEVNLGEMGCAVNGDNSLENFIVYKGDDQGVQTPVINGDKGNIYKITLDMNNLTYKVVRQAVNYYIVGGPNDWAGSCSTKELKFNQANIDIPVYTIVFPAAAEGDTWFAIGDDKACDAIANGEDGAWDLLYATTKGNGNNGTDGTLCRRNQLEDRDKQGDGSFKVEAGAKFISVTINMKEMTYEIKPLSFERFVYFIGATDGWANAEQKLESPNYDGVYTGFLYCADPNGWGNEFKFQKVPGDWGTEINSGHMTGGITGDFADGGGNFKANAGEGVYYVTLNLAAGTLNAVKVEKMGIIGDFNSWGGDVDMTWNATDYCFEATDAGVTDAGWKFRVNADWAINLGGKTLDNLEANGDNLTAVGTKIKLYPTRKGSDNIYCTVE